MNIAYTLLLVISVAQPPTTGSITGAIRYTGVIPPSQRITLTDGSLLMHNDVVVDAKTKGLRDVVVLLDWKEKTPLDAKAKPVVVDQRDLLFVPRVITVQAGRKVRFENNDSFNHCVGAKSVIAENSFNVTTPAGQPYEHQFKAQKNPIPIDCALHSWMRAWIIVAEHPYHAVTDARGAFRIDGVPAGKHKLLLIHPETNYRDAITIDVQAGKTADVAVEWKSLKK
jgi:plastocyanin